MSLPIPPRWSNAVRECSRSVTRASAQQMRRTPQQCAFSTTSPVSEEPGAERRDRPRWQQTPKAMAMPIRVRDPPRQAPYIVNTDSKVLDQAYNKMLGRGGDSMLPEEIKWLAVTHKSFDHGRRGFNDKLAFLGMMTCSHGHWDYIDGLYRKEDSGPAVLFGSTQRSSGSSTACRSNFTSCTTRTGKS